MSRDTPRQPKPASGLPTSSRRAKNELHPLVREGLATLRGQAALGERAGKRARRVTDRTNEPRIPTSPHLTLPSGGPVARRMPREALGAPRLGRVRGLGRRAGDHLRAPRCVRGDNSPIDHLVCPRRGNEGHEALDELGRGEDKGRGPVAPDALEPHSGMEAVPGEARARLADDFHQRRSVNPRPSPYSSPEARGGSAR
jgi:hypothetical protein